MVVMHAGWPKRSGSSLIVALKSLVSNRAFGPLEAPRRCLFCSKASKSIEKQSHERIAFTFYVFLIIDIPLQQADKRAANRTVKWYARQP